MTLGVDDGPPTDDVRFRCPGCDEEVDVPAGSVGQLVRCPYCNTSFFAADGHTTADVIDDTEGPPPDDAPRPDELDANRIRQLSALRRATLRTRSWWVIAAALAGSAAVDLLVKAGRAVAHGLGLWATLLAVVGGTAALATVVALRQARQLTREADGPPRPDPVDPPDFSTLDDGSNRWRELDQIR